MGVRAGQTPGKTCSPRGQRAVVRLTGRRFCANLISAVDAEGLLVFDVFQSTCDDEVRVMDFPDKLQGHSATLIKMALEYLATRTREIVSNHFRGAHVSYAQ